MRLCSVDGCGRKHVARGLCGRHYMDAKRGLIDFGARTYRVGCCDPGGAAAQLCPGHLETRRACQRRWVASGRAAANSRRWRTQNKRWARAYARELARRKYWKDPATARAKAAAWSMWRLRRDSDGLTDQWMRRLLGRTGWRRDDMAPDKYCDPIKLKREAVALGRKHGIYKPRRKR